MGGITRKYFLKILIFLGAVSIVPKRLEPLFIGNGGRRSSQGLIIGDGLYFESHALKNRPISVGNTLSFIPLLGVLHHFQEGELTRPAFKNIYQNIYEFYFRPVKNIFNPLHPYRYDYIIKLAPDFYVYHYNWTKKYEDYLQLNKMYWGYGMLHSAVSDPSGCNPYVPGMWMKKITRTWTVKRIGVAHDDRHYFEKKCPWVEGEVYTGEDYLGKLGYPHRYFQFKKKVIKKKWYIRELESSESRDTYEVLNFEVQLI